MADAPKNLYEAYGEELLSPLRAGGFNKDNISSEVKIYEALDGTLKAAISPSDVAENGRCESIGFWLWCSFDEYKAAQDGKDNIFDAIDAGFEVNLQALKGKL